MGTSDRYRQHGLRGEEGRSWVNLAKLARKTDDLLCCHHALLNATHAGAAATLVQRAKYFKSKNKLDLALRTLEVVACRG